FLTAPPPTHIYPLSLHDALPIYVELVSPKLRACTAIEVVEDDIFSRREEMSGRFHALRAANILNRGYFVDAFIRAAVANLGERLDRKSTRLNSSHDQISYAVFCL